VRCTDGVERDVYEDADGRQYVVGDQGEKVYGLWPGATSTRPHAAPEETAPSDDKGDQESPKKATEDAPEEVPWEGPGATRRDRESHRGRMLALLGSLSFGLSVMAVPCGLFGIPGLGLGLYVRLAARRDLHKMAEGGMDPDGAPGTRGALQDATLGIVLSGVGIFLSAVAAVALLFVYF